LYWAFMQGTLFRQSPLTTPIIQILDGIQLAVQRAIHQHRVACRKAAEGAGGAGGGEGGAAAPPEGKEAWVDFVRIDGSTPPVERQALVRRFRDEPMVKVAIVGVTAGGVGAWPSPSKQYLCLSDAGLPFNRLRPSCSSRCLAWHNYILNMFISVLAGLDLSAASVGVFVEFPPSGVSWLRQAEDRWVGSSAITGLSTLSWTLKPYLRLRTVSSATHL
jgi:hypothetical protein